MEQNDKKNLHYFCYHAIFRGNGIRSYPALDLEFSRSEYPYGADSGP